MDLLLAATLHYIFLTESILGERSRTVARIKRENFHRGVSCIEPFGEQAESSHARVVSWEDTKKKTGQEALNRKGVKEETSNIAAPQTNSGDREKESKRTEVEKLRAMISIRRGSIDQKSAPDQSGGKGHILKAEEGLPSEPREKTEARGRVKMTDGPRPRPLLVRGSSCNPQQALKTSERPPLSRGFSVQARRTPAITITRPHTTIEDGHHRPKIDILEAVSEIHDTFKDNTDKAYIEDFTGEETEEDEFHESLRQGDPCDPHKTQLTTEWRMR